MSVYDVHRYWVWEHPFEVDQVLGDVRLVLAVREARPGLAAFWCSAPAVDGRSVVQEPFHTCEIVSLYYRRHAVSHRYGKAPRTLYAYS